MHTGLNRIPRCLRRHSLIKGLIALFPKQKFQKFRCDDFTIIANLQDAEARNAFCTKHFEDYGFYRIAPYFLDKKNVFFDVGANYGFMSYGLLSKLKNKNIRYYLFEPNPLCQKCLHASKLLYPHETIQIETRALSNTDQTLKLCFDTGNAGSGIVINAQETIEPASKNDYKKITVTSTSLDDYIKKHEIRAVHLMKIDTEGSETKILQGAKQSLASGALRALYIELNEKALNVHLSSTEELLSLLESYNYKLYYPHTKPHIPAHALRLGNNALDLSPLVKKSVIEDILNSDKTLQLDIVALHPKHPAFKL